MEIIVPSLDNSRRSKGPLQAGKKQGFKSVWTGLAAGCAIIVSQPAIANNVGENGAWQFETTADKANKAFVEDMRQKKASGYYAAPVYTTNIDRQYNCSVSSLATGNQSSSSAIGNSPSTTGHSTKALGNNDTVDVAQGASSASSSVSSSQANQGEVEAETTGNVSGKVDGNTYQTLNTEQQNSGNQSAAVSASNACQFGALN